MERNICILVLLMVLLVDILHTQYESEKCGTFVGVRLRNEAKKNQLDLPMEIRPELQKSILTPSSKIRIHYDTVNAHEPALVSITYVNGKKIVTRRPNTYKQFIDTLALLFDSVWRAEIDQFGFTPPPSDNGRGGGNEFDVYVLNMGAGYFGETLIEWDLPVGVTKSNQQYASFIKFENDFGTGYRTNGIEAMMATAAHEFHHAIQIGGSGIWEGEYFYFYELCAESMEPIVFREAKDYLFDVKTYFKNISGTPLFQQRTDQNPIETAGYERAIWAIFLMKNYSISLMGEIWNEIKIQRPVSALNTVLNRHSTSIQREFINFTYWNFFTAHRADTARYYTDAKLYPLVPFLQTISVGPSVQQLSVSTHSFTPNYYKVISNSDSTFFVVSNTDYTDALTYSQKLFSSQISVTTSAHSGYDAVAAGLYAKFSSSNIENWSFIPIGLAAHPYCFPNPFKPAESSLLISPGKIGVSDDVTLTVVSAVSLDLIYSKRAEYSTFSGTQYVTWMGRDNRGEIVPSGVYLYILSNGSTVLKGKFAVIR
ncbi:MAG: MXAN_6640 family putative metalloprotease [Bacteriovoracaceae bacterium]|nr:hypothetical protein [Bacteroidota bacterium]